MSFETQYAEPQQAVRKPVTNPWGSPAPPKAAPPSTVTPGSPPSPMGSPRFNPYEYGPNAPDGYKTPMRGKRGMGAGHTGWNSKLGIPQDREIPRSRHQLPEQYRTPGFRPKATSRVTGKEFRPRDIRIPTTNPQKVPRAGGMPKLSKAGLGTVIIDDLMNPQGGSYGGLPDFFKRFPDPAPQPEPGTQNSVCGEPCLSALSIGKMGTSSGSVYQYRVLEYAGVGNTSTSNAWGPPPWSRSLGIFKIFSEGGYPEGFYPSGSIIRQYKGLQGKETYVDADGLEYVRYAYWVQNKGRIPYSGRKWVGTVGTWWGDPRLKRTDTGPNISTDGADFGGYSKLPSNISVSFMCRVFLCDEQYDTEPVDPNDYDREEDDKVACKWLTENNQDVDQLEIGTYTYQKFTGCNFRSDGSENFYEEKEIRAPKGLGESLVAILDTQSKMLGALCVLPVPVPVVPDWLPQKVSNVPKLVVLFAEEKNGKKQSAKYEITIPHWIKSQSDTKAGDFTSYTKGQSQCIYEMKDGSRITVNADGDSLAENIVRMLLNGVDPAYKNGDVPPAGKRRGRPLAKIDLFPVEARFYDKNTDEIKPIWVRRFVD
jgi:hypothetical protein